MEDTAANQLAQGVEPGDVIWVQHNGSSSWPAQVVDENSVSENSKPQEKSAGDVLVRIYGSYQHLYVDPVKCRSEFEIVLEQNNGSHKEIFENALKEDLHSLRKGKSKGRVQKTKGVHGPAANVGVDISKDEKLNQKQKQKKKETEASSDKKADNVRITRAMKADLDAKSSKDDVSVKEGSSLPSDKKISISDDSSPATVSPRVSPRRQSKAKEKGKASSSFGQDCKPKKHDPKRSSPNDSESDEQDKAHKKIKRESSSTGNRSKSKSSKQSASQERKGGSHGTRIKRKHLEDDDEEQNELVPSSPSSNDDTPTKSPKQDKVTTSAGKSPEASERRRRVMQVLGLVAPYGSPFSKN